MYESFSKALLLTSQYHFNIDWKYEAALWIRTDGRDIVEVEEKYWREIYEAEIHWWRREGRGHEVMRTTKLQQREKRLNSWNGETEVKKKTERKIVTENEALCFLFLYIKCASVFRVSDRSWDSIKLDVSFFVPLLFKNTSFNPTDPFRSSAMIGCPDSRCSSLSCPWTSLSHLWANKW